MASALVIGSGFAGCTAALVLKKKGHEVTLVERAPFLGGGCKTHHYGGHPYTFGPRHFVTKDEDLFAFVHDRTPLRRIPEHEFLTFVESDPGFYSYPVHEDDIASMPDRDVVWAELSARDPHAVPAHLEAYWINALGPTIYSKFVKAYTQKMWAIDSNTELEPGSTWPPDAPPLRTGPKAAWTDCLSAFPKAANGYDDYFVKTTDGARVLLSTSIEAFDIEHYRVKMLGEWHTFDLIVSTISPELLLGNVFGPLRWMGRDLLKLVLPVPFAFPPNVYSVYYANTEPFTRAVEYKKFYRGESSSTLICLELPSTKNKLFPFPRTKERAEAQRYLDALPERVFSIGRAGRYDYSVGIAEAIKQALELRSIC